MVHYDRYIGSEEWTFITLGSIATLNALAFLVCQWSVSIKAMLTCTTETDVRKAQLIKIIPNRHKGTGTFCEIHRGKFNAQENGEISFVFQKKKYIWDGEKKMFL
ncbi:hypothetical protein BZG36_03215, partial [Bifiguratus adelaidae]